MFFSSRVGGRRLLAPVTVFPLVLAMLAAGLIVFVTQETTTTPSAQAARAVMAKHGTGYLIRGQWFGTWRTAQGNGFCIDFDRSDPDSSGVNALDGKVPSRSSEESAEVKFIANRYGTTSSSLDGAAAAIVVWKTQHIKRFDSYYAKLLRANAISPKLQKRVSTMTAEAKNHGPFRLTMKLGAGYVGQPIAGSITATAKNGRPAAGMAMKLTINANGTLVKGARTTNSRGAMAFGATVNRVGQVRTDALLVTPSTKTAFLSRPTNGRQRLLIASAATETARVSAVSLRSIGGPTVTSVCDADCRGVAKVTVSMQNPCGAAPLREFVRVNGRLVTLGGTVDVGPCQSKSTTVAAPDNAVVTTSYCYLRAGVCRDTPVANPGSLTVVCPAWVEYRFSGSCPCGKAKTITYAVQAPLASTRAYTATLTTTDKAGKRTPQTLTLRNGTWQNFAPVALAQGDEVQLSFATLGKTHILDSVLQQG